MHSHSVTGVLGEASQRVRHGDISKCGSVGGGGVGVDELEVESCSFGVGAGHIGGGGGDVDHRNRRSGASHSGREGPRNDRAIAILAAAIFAQGEGVACLGIQIVPGLAVSFERFAPSDIIRIIIGSFYQCALVPSTFLGSPGNSCAVAGEVAGGKTCRSGASYSSGEAHGVGEHAISAATAVVLHSDLVCCFGSEASECIRILGDFHILLCNKSIGRIANLPSIAIAGPTDVGSVGRHVGNGNACRFGAGGNVVDAHVVDVQVVVGVGYGGFAVEGNGDVLAGIAAQVDGNEFASGSGSDVVIDIFRASIVPLAQGGPCFTTIGRDKNGETVVGASGCGSTQCAAKGGQCQIEGKLDVVFHKYGRGDQPVIATGAIDVDTGVAIKHAIACAKRPAISYSANSSSSIWVQQAVVHAPAARNVGVSESLVNRDTEHGLKAHVLPAAHVAAAHALHSVLVSCARGETGQVGRGGSGVGQVSCPIRSRTTFVLHVVGAAAAGPGEGGAVGGHVGNLKGCRLVAHRAATGCDNHLNVRAVGRFSPRRSAGSVGIVVVLAVTGHGSSRSRALP